VLAVCGKRGYATNVPGRRAALRPTTLPEEAPEDHAGDGLLQHFAWMVSQTTGQSFRQGPSSYKFSYCPSMQTALPVTSLDLQSRGLLYRSDGIGRCFP